MFTNYKKSVDQLIIPLSKIDQEKWKKVLPIIEYPSSRVIFYKGHFPYGLYVFHQGNLSLTTSTHRKEAEISAPFLLGYETLLSHKPYGLNATTTSKARVSFLPKSEFYKWCDQSNPLVMIQLPQIKKSSKTEIIF